MTRSNGRSGRPTGFLHNARVDLFLEVSDRSNRAEDCFSHARVASTHARLAWRLLLPFRLLSILRIVPSTNRYNMRFASKRKSEREKLRAQIFDCNLSTVKSVYLPRSLFWFRHLLLARLALSSRVDGESSRHVYHRRDLSLSLFLSCFLNHLLTLCQKKSSVLNSLLYNIL